MAGIGFLSWLLIDIRSYVNKIRNLSARCQNARDAFKLIDGPDGETLISIPLDALVQERIPRYYCFAQGRHSGSFFLKIGASFFGLGHLILLGLQLIKQV